MFFILDIFPNQFVFDLLLVLLGAGLTIITFIITERLKTKLIVFKKNITYQVIGMSSKSERWGDIRITWNGAEFNNLYFFTIEIINDTFRNAPKNMVIQLSVDVNSVILNQSGELLHNGTFLQLLLEDNYFQSFQDINKQWFALPENERNASSPLYKELDPIVRNKKFVVPIFNRKSSLIFNLLVVSSTNDVPVINAFIIEDGISLNWDKSESRKQQEKLWINILVWILWIASIFPIISYSPTKAWVAWLLVASSFVAWGIGHGIIYLLKTFRLI